ncbi:putative RNA-binding protein [Smittium culicis]|uniref:Putative RNA-binding protein n=1 Tax=Smittium culicis TaxID=133412 RepID=A0A1R1YPG4_9FUNG|nr:putative RNA-binding protein [Smittium culicis]
MGSDNDNEKILPLSTSSEIIADSAIIDNKSDSTAIDKKSKTYGCTSLFVRGIPLEATNEQLQDFFAEIGPVRSCFIVYEKPELESPDSVLDLKQNNPSEKKSKGFGFVHYALAEDAKVAVDVLSDKLFLDKKRLLLEFAIKKGLPNENRQFSEKRKARKEISTSVAKKSKNFDLSLASFIKISGLDKSVNTKALKHKARKSGEVKQIYFVEYSDTSAFTGEAFIQFSTSIESKRAVKALNDHTFKGAKITAELLNIKLDKTSRLIIRNLPFKMRENDIVSLFSKYGLVVEVSLPRKFTGGPLKGFSFVQMLTSDQAENAIKSVNGTRLEDRTVAVDRAVQKDEYSKMISETTQDDNNSSSDSDSDADNNSDDDDNVSDNENESDSTSPKTKKSKNNSTDNSDDDADDSDDEKNKQSLNFQDQENTLFVKNVPFETTEEELFDLFRHFGKVKYCRIVLDKKSLKSRGTAFVNFWENDDAKKCLSDNAEAIKLSQDSIASNNIRDNSKKDSKDPKKFNPSSSVLLQENPKSLSVISIFTIKGRLLNLSSAVSHQKAQDLADINMRQRIKLDKRNTYLIREGVVFPNSESASKLTPEELEAHQKYYGTRKYQLSRNPNLIMSKTRLCIRNIPKSVTEPELRKVAQNSITLFKTKVKENKIAPLSKDEMLEGWDKLPKLSQVKLLRSETKNATGVQLGKSTGMGFVEFKSHAHALACLRALNLSYPNKIFSNASNSSKSTPTTSEKRLLFVEFAIENILTLRKRENQIAKSLKTQEDLKNSSEAPPTRESNKRPAQSHKQPQKETAKRFKDNNKKPTENTKPPKTSNNPKPNKKNSGEHFESAKSMMKNMLKSTNFN